MKTKLVPFSIEKAQAGAKIVTRNGSSVRMGFFDLKNKTYPISGAIKEGEEEYVSAFTSNGRFASDKVESDFDLFVEEEVEEEETDYNPYKEAIKSISDMVERYSDDIDWRDFYDNVKAKCREAIEYDNTLCKNKDENPADNKHRFQEGDWVLDCLDIAHQIIRVVENVGSHTYGYDTADGYYVHDSSSSVRLWTIQDAKDGDVLYSLDSKQPFIFKHRKHLQQADVYCGINIYGKFFVENTDDCIIVVDKYVPADKFQREHLFKKMKEAGYEWNADKKELKKIEKKTRRMTNQELAWWLRDKPEEHRELKMSVDDPIIDSLYYYDNETNVTVSKDIIIRRNGGEWEEPLIEE